MSVAVGKIDGVEQVDVSLNEGVAVVTFASGNNVSMERIRRVIRQNGFTPKHADVRVRGTIERTEDGSYLVLPGGMRFVLGGEVAPPTGGVVELQGTVAETAANQPGPWPLTVRRPGPGR